MLTILGVITNLNYIVQLPPMPQAYVLEHCTQYETKSVLYFLIFSRRTKLSFHSRRTICYANNDYYRHFTFSGNIVT